MIERWPFWATRNLDDLAIFIYSVYEIEATYRHIYNANAYSYSYTTVALNYKL